MQVPQMMYQPNHPIPVCFQSFPSAEPFLHQRAQGWSVAATYHQPGQALVHSSPQSVHDSTYGVGNAFSSHGAQGYHCVPAPMGWTPVHQNTQGGIEAPLFHSKEASCSPMTPSTQPQHTRNENIKRNLSRLDHYVQERNKRQVRISAKKLQGLGTILSNHEASHQQTCSSPDVPSLDSLSLALGSGPLVTRASLIKALNLDPLNSNLPKRRELAQPVRPRQDKITKDVADYIAKAPPSHPPYPPMLRRDISEASTVAEEDLCAARDDTECQSVVGDEQTVPEKQACSKCEFVQMTSEADPESKKRLRNLLKKLRQIEILEQRQLAGTQLDKDAMDKLTRKADLLTDIKALLKDTPGAAEDLGSLSADAVAPRNCDTAGVAGTHLDEGATDKPLCKADLLTDAAMLCKETHHATEDAASLSADPVPPENCDTAVVVGDHLDEDVMDNLTDNAMLRKETPDAAEDVASLCADAAAPRNSDSHTAHEQECHAAVSKKELRSLEKKLRQIEMLEERQRQGKVLDSNATGKISCKRVTECQIQDLREQLGMMPELQKSSSAQVDLSPEVQDVVHFRSFLLGFRFFSSDKPTAGTLCTAADPKTTHQSTHKGKHGDVEASKCSMDRSIFGTNMPVPKKTQKTPFKPSESGYRIQKPATREVEVERNTRNLLNILCPDNFDRLLARFRSIHINDETELEVIVSLIVDKALEECHYCQTYVKLVYCLKDVYPAFPPSPESVSGRPQTFMTVLKDNVQQVFESTLPFIQALPKVHETFGNYLQHTRQDHKAQAIASMKLIGELFLWKLLPFKLVHKIGTELTNPETRVTETMLECVCVFLQSTGHTLDYDVSGGKMFVTEMLQRMDNQCLSCSKRFQTIIRNTKDNRLQGWQCKLYREEAKTKDAVKKDAGHDVVKAEVAEEAFAMRVMGARPTGVEQIDAMIAAFRVVIDQDKANKSILVSSKSPQKDVEADDSTRIDRAFVKRTLSYFFEEGNCDQLARDWQQVQASEKQGPGDQEAQLLLEIGSENSNWDLCAQAIVELASRDLLPRETLQGALSQSLRGLNDLLHDCPRADRFFASLLARLLMVQGEDFFEQVIKNGMSGDADEDQMKQRLMLGITEKLRSLEASHFVDYMLEKHVAPGQQ